METFLPAVLISTFGLCCYLLSLLMREESPRKKPSQKPILDAVLLSSAKAEPKLPELTGADIIRGYDSPEVCRYDVLIRVGLFLKSAKRPVSLS
jgi:hypothetical protein